MIGNVEYQPLVDLARQRIAGVRAVYLYGSQATRSSRTGSDIDIAILADTPLPPVMRFDLMGEMAAMMGRDVDLVDLRAASTVLRSQIIGQGVRLYGVGSTIEEFEDRVFSAYARLNEERAGIIADIHERGSIHGR